MTQAPIHLEPPTSGTSFPEKRNSSQRQSTIPELLAANEREHLPTNVMRNTFTPLTRHMFCTLVGIAAHIRDDAVCVGNLAVMGFGRPMYINNTHAKTINSVNAIVEDPEERVTV